MKSNRGFVNQSKTNDNGSASRCCVESRALGLCRGRMRPNAIISSLFVLTPPTVNLLRGWSTILNVRGRNFLLPGRTSTIDDDDAHHDMTITGCRAVLTIDYHSNSVSYCVLFNSVVVLSRASIITFSGCWASGSISVLLLNHTSLHTNTNTNTKEDGICTSSGLADAAQLPSTAIHNFTVQIALGTDYAGMWSSDEDLAKELNDVRRIRTTVRPWY